VDTLSLYPDIKKYAQFLVKYSKAIGSPKAEALDSNQTLESKPSDLAQVNLWNPNLQIWKKPWNPNLQI